ncbi:DegQ family serine endoprotease [Hoeflea marina]|uniref:DegQ family serine endoprotease n=1 Tax=Hoeflea marina TaxID=274592 RepID=UPI003CCA50CB
MIDGDKAAPVPDSSATGATPAPQAEAAARAGDEVVRQVPQSRGDMLQSFSPLVKQTAPAVVNVYADRTVQSRSPFAGDPFFEQFFGQRMPNRTEKQSSLGSGVMVEASGIIITNNHVIEGADDIRVALADGREFESKVLLKDERFDVAILKIEGDGPFPTIEFGDSDALEVGDLVLAIGNPFGVGQTVTSGIISALARNRVGISDFGFFIQTDAAINPGNSGGALIDMNGRLIGINTAIFSRSGGSNGIGFAIPANLVRAVALAAEAGGDRFERPYIGATFETLTPEIADALGLENSNGALVSAVEDGGPAAKAGLKPGDVVVAMNGQSVQHPDALGYRLATTGVGGTADFTVRGRGGERTVTIALVPMPADAPGSKLLIGGDSPFAGVTVADLSPRLASDLRMPPNTSGVVVVDVTRRSLAERYGFEPRDIIAAVNGAEIRQVDDLRTALGGKPGFWKFDVIRNGRLMRQFIR